MWGTFVLLCSSIRNFLASRLDCIVVQMWKTNGEMSSSKLQMKKRKYLSRKCGYNCLKSESWSHGVVLLSDYSFITALFNNTRTLKLKVQPTNAFFTAVNQVFGGSSQLTTAAELCSLSELCTTIWSPRARQQSKAGRGRRTFDWR